MHVVALSIRDALARLAAEHGVKASAETITRELMASVMRAQLARMFPCPSHLLVTATKHALEGLTDDVGELSNLADDVLEDLQTCGDAVELARVTTAQDEARSQWQFPAPPAYVVRGRRAYLSGIAPDNAPFLPEDHWRRIQMNGAARFLELDEVGALNQENLSALGLRQLDEKDWLGAERNETAVEHIARLHEMLSRSGLDGYLPGMKVLARQTSPRQSYSRRWVNESAASGLHVVRVEQPYGAPLWYVADLRSGRCVRSMLLPRHLESGRGCDQAWRAQLAIDASQGDGAQYSVHRKGNETVLTLDFPIPLAARRRLVFLGGSSVRGESPYVFVIPHNEEHSERHYLEENLWFREA